MSTPPNPFLAGNFAPIRTEDDFQLEIEGKFPTALAGTYYRNGPNPQFEPMDDYHPFAADGMIHALTIEDGQVSYRNRFVRTPHWEAENRAGRALFGGMNGPPIVDPEAANVERGTANTNIVWHANRLLALQESNQPFELDPDTLAPLGYVRDYAGAVTAHPKLDAETGEMVWFAHNVGEMPLGPTMSYGVTDASGKIVRRDNFEAPYCSLAHDFLITRRHVLFPVLPAAGDLARVMTGGPAFAWEKDKPACIGVMVRDAGVETIRWFETEACHFYHPMNAWEEGDLIHADVMEFPRAPLMPDPDGTPAPNVASRMMRWTFNLAQASNAIEREQIDDLSGELPRFDERRTGLKYRHGWIAGCSVPTGASAMAFDMLAHLDLQTGKRITYAVGPGDSVGEPLFIPRSASAPEGDGWVIALVHRGETNRSELLAFDAQDLASGPIGTARAPRRIPVGFHGNWRAADR